MPWTLSPQMLRIVRNRTWNFDAVAYDTYVGEGDPGNVPTNHSGWSIRSQIRSKVGNKLVANLDVTFPVPTSGSIAIRHDRDFTRSLAVGDYLWDIVATDTEGIDHEYVGPEAIEVRDHPTDPANATYNFVPGGGGVISHTHTIAEVTGLQAELDGLQDDIDGLQAEVDALELPGIRAIRTITADATLTGTDRTVLVDATAAAVEITLPLLTGHQGRIYSIKKFDATANVVTVTAAGDNTIEGEAFLDTDIPGESITIHGFGTNWNII